MMIYYLTYTSLLSPLLQLISDAGYQGEITSVSTACHQLEVFSRVLKTSVSSYLSDTEAFLKNNIHDFAVSHNF